jgi:hypothetical protein
VHEHTASESKRAQVGGLIVGGLSFLHPLIMVGSFVLNIRELVKGRGGERRWMNVTGLVLTCVAVLTWVVGLTILATSG